MWLAAICAVPVFASGVLAVCPPLGPVLLAPRSPGGNEEVKAASKQLRKAFDTFAAQYNSSGISVAVKSIHEDDPLFSYQVSPRVTSGIGTQSIDENTIFRVGSMSKLFTALAILQTGSIRLEDSILKYIPELENPASVDDIDTIDWQDITVGSLMAHLSGLTRDSESGTHFIERSDS